MIFRVINILGSALKVVLGSGAGQISQSYTYALIATDLGALLRIDIDIYSFSIVSKGLQEHAKDMTAVSSLVSSIDASGLTKNDLRGIVSLSYGNSSLDTQKDIYNVIEQAWENTKAAQEGKTLPNDALSQIKALFVPSKYEVDMKRRNASLKGPASSHHTPGRKKVGRAELREAWRKFVAARSDASSATAPAATAPTGTALAGTTPAGVAPAPNGPALPSTAPAKDPQWRDIFIWAKLQTQANEDWLAHITSAFQGFNEENMFKYVGIDGGKSGSAVAFHCAAASADISLFDLALAYCEHTVLPALSGSAYISEGVISTFAIQYDHPSVSGSPTLTAVKYKENSVQNNAGVAVEFHFPDARDAPLIIEAGKSATLTGAVHHLSLHAIPTGDSDTPTIEGPQWVTYQKIDPADIIMKSGATLEELPAGGYRMVLYGAGDKVVNIDYSSPWEQ